MQKQDISDYTFDQITSEKDQYNRCYFIFTKFKSGKVIDMEKSIFLDKFIETIKDVDKSDATYLFSYIFKYLSEDEREKLLPHFINHSGAYNPSAYGDILPFCNDEQKNIIILEKKCVQGALYRSYGDTKRNYDEFRCNLNRDPIFKNAINEINEEILKGAFEEIDQVCQGKTIDFERAKKIESSDSWKITIGVMIDEILNQEKSHLNFIEQQQITQSLSKG